MSTALITTCYQEADSIEGFLDAVLTQTRQPDEIVIVDAGSSDGTAEAIRARIEAGAEIAFLVEDGANRSVGRNLAIRTSTAELIAVTDVGSVPRADWFERIIVPLEKDDTADVVAGYYESQHKTTWEAAVSAATVPSAAEVDAESFLPSSRSVAFRRTAWDSVGGYPEHASHNEDTPFDLALKQQGARFVFEPAAIVDWQPHASPRRLFAQFCRYARGDAQCRLWFGHYKKAYVVTAAAALVIAGGISWSPVLLALVPGGVAYWLRHAARARRRTASLAGAALAPLANAILDLAHVAGYTRGWAARTAGKISNR